MSIFNLNTHFEITFRERIYLDVEKARSRLWRNFVATGKRVVERFAKHSFLRVNAALVSPGNYFAVRSDSTR